MMGLDAVDLGGWLSLVVLVAVGASLVVWFGRIVWQVANWGRRWSKRHRPAAGQ